MLTNKLRLVVEISTEGMVDERDIPAVAERVAVALRNWADNSEEGLVSTLPHEGDEGAVTLEVKVFSTSTRELELELLARS